MTPERPDVSYRALLAIPKLGRTLVSMQISRVAQTMVGVALVLFVLDKYHSPGLAGVVTFASVFPGLVVAPIAGALLDRHGRVRLIIVDYVVAWASLALIGVLALLDALPAPLLVGITAVSSLTSILSHTGMRSLFPMLVPPHLWERVNAIDSNGYVVATILGPPIAATLVTLAGGPVTLIIVGTAFAFAAAAMIGAPDPETDTTTTGSLLRDAWEGVRYTWSNPTLRALGFSVSVLNIAGGMISIAIPLIVLDRLHLGEPVVGLVFAVSGVTGMISALAFGRRDTRGRERRMIVFPTLLAAPTLAILLLAVGATTPALGLLALGFAMAVYGLLQGPMDIAMFTIRQRRTDPAWMGRAFAVSMAFNFVGFPVGAALAGTLATASLEAAVILGVVAALVGAGFAAWMIPQHDERATATAVVSAPVPGAAESP